MPTKNIGAVASGQGIGWSDAQIVRLGANQIGNDGKAFVRIGDSLTGMPLGNAATPSISPVGKSDSGIYWINTTTIAITANGSDRFHFGSTGLLASIIGYAVGTTPSGADVRYGRTSATMAKISSGATGGCGVHLYALSSAPSAPAAGSAYVYLISNGGKMELNFLAPTGAVQQIAIEP